MALDLHLHVKQKISKVVWKIDDMIGALGELAEKNRDVMEDSFTDATYYAEYLVKKGLPFR